MLEHTNQLNSVAFTSCKGRIKFTIINVVIFIVVVIIMIVKFSLSRKSLRREPNGNNDHSKPSIMRHFYSLAYFGIRFEGFFLSDWRIDTCIHSLKYYRVQVFICFLLIVQYTFHKNVFTSP